MNVPLRVSIKLNADFSKATGEFSPSEKWEDLKFCEIAKYPDHQYEQSSWHADDADVKFIQHDGASVSIVLENGQANMVALCQGNQILEYDLEEYPLATIMAYAENLVGIPMPSVVFNDDAFLSTVKAFDERDDDAWVVLNSLGAIYKTNIGYLLTEDSIQRAVKLGYSPVRIPRGSGEGYGYYR